MTNQNSIFDQEVPDPPLLCRQSHTLCKSCGWNTSFSTHLYCNSCCGKREDNIHDRLIRDNVILYHLLTTYKNTRGIAFFNKPAETDNNWVKRYIKVLSKFNTATFEKYYNDPIISSKLNQNDYFNTLN